MLNLFKVTHINKPLASFGSPSTFYYMFVEGLNVINVTKCNKVLNVITFGPKCNKPLNLFLMLYSIVVNNRNNTALTNSLALR